MSIPYHSKQEPTTTAVEHTGTIFEGRSLHKEEGANVKLRRRLQKGIDETIPFQRRPFRHPYSLALL